MALLVPVRKMYKLLLNKAENMQIIYLTLSTDSVIRKRGIHGKVCLYLINERVLSPDSYSPSLNVITQIETD